VRLAVVILALTACGQPMQGHCRTLCGVEIDNWLPNRSDWSCESVQAQEDAVLVQLIRANDERFKESCSRMSGVHVSFENKDELDAGGKPLLGETHCWDKTVTLNNLAPWDSAYAHEMSHIIQDCSPNSCAHSSMDSQHWCWDTNGIVDAIRRVGNYTFHNKT